MLKAQQDEAAHSLKQLETSLAKAVRNLSFTVIRAPFDGVLGNRAVQTGDYVEPGQRFASPVPLSWWRTYLTSDWDFWELVWPQIFRGVSLMTAIISINNVALGTLPPERVKNASGLYNLTRNLGAAFGLAGLTTVLNDRTDLHLARLHERLTFASRPAVEALNDFATQLKSHGNDTKVWRCNSSWRSLTLKAWSWPSPMSSFSWPFSPGLAVRSACGVCHRRQEASRAAARLRHDRSRAGAPPALLDRGSAVPLFP